MRESRSYFDGIEYDATWAPVEAKRPRVKVPMRQGW